MWYLIALFIITVYSVVDFNFFIHAAITIFVALFFRSDLHFLETGELYGICLLSDTDINIHHMNNTKYFRELEYAKWDFLIRIGMKNFWEVMRNGTPVVAAGTIIRYRSAIKLFGRYKILSTIKYWDHRSFFLEQKFVCLSDGKTKAIGYTKVTFVKRDAINEFVKDLEKPELTPDLKAYIDAHDALEAVQQKLIKPD